MKDMKRFSVVFLSLLVLAAAAGSVAPEWGNLKLLTGKSAVFLTENDRRPIRITVEPDRALAAAVVVRPEKEGFALDTAPVFEKGARKVNVCFLTIPEKEFPAARYRLSLTVEGPKGSALALYFEGKTPDGKHFYKMKPATLSGARETFTFDEAVPRKMEELHLRFDFLSPGLYRIFDAGFEAVDAPVPAPVSARKPTARKPELIFYAPFDGNGEAVTAGGRKSPLEERNTVYTEGIRGGALRTSKAAGSMLRYAVSGNLLPDAGTISLWFKPEWKAFAGTSSERSGWRTLLTMDRPASRLGSGAVWFWCWGNLLRGDTSDMRDDYRTSSLILEPGNWRHLAFTWDENTGEKHLYINGRRVDSRRDGDSPLRLRSAEPAAAAAPIESFFVGGFGESEQADGLIDELKIFSAPLSAEALRREAGTLLPLELEVHSNYLPAGGESLLDFTVLNRGSGPVPVRWRLLDAGGRIVAESAEESLIPRDGAKRFREAVGALAGGRHRLEVPGNSGREGATIWKFRADSPWSVPAGELKLEPVDRVLPDPELGPERFLVIGELRRGTLDGRPYLEAGRERGDRFAVRFQLPDAESAYLIEWEYPDDAKRTADIIAQSSQLKESEYELQTGYAAGDEYRNTGRMLVQRNIYFPRSKDITLVFMSARADAPAAVGEIRIFRIAGGLPDAAVKPAEPVDGWTRTVGIYYEDPAINNGFGVNGTSIDQFETMVDRLIAYMKYSGQNLLAYPMVWYHGYIGEEYNPRSHIPEFAEAFLTKFDAAGLEFMATMNQNNIEIPPGMVTREAVESGALHDSPVAIWDTGKPNPGGWHGTPPNFNILHPDVQKEVLANLDRILKVGAPHPSFKGVVLHLPRHAMLWFGDLKSGYNDYAVEAFEKETGIQVPVDRNDPMRGRLYAEWLLANAREPWIDWRCRKLSEFYRILAERIAAARPDLRLVINSMIPVPEIGAANYTAADFVKVKNREAGLDPRYYAGIGNVILDQTVYPADYRWRGGKPIRPEVHQRLRTIDMEPGYYEFLTSAKLPWIHMHDRYWESAIGASNRKDHWSDKPNALQAPWFREQGWRVSTVNPAGFHAMRHYVLPLRYQDLLGVTKGGFLIGSYGMEPYLVPFARAFRALPAKRFSDLETASEVVKARKLDHGGSTYFYVVNTADVPAVAEVSAGSGKVIDLVSGGEVAVSGGAFRIELGPYQLRSFRIPGGATVGVTVK